MGMDSFETNLSSVEIMYTTKGEGDGEDMQLIARVKPRQGKLKKMFFYLQVKARAEGIESLSVPADRSLWFKLKCFRCGLECGPVDIDPSAPLSEIENSPAGAQLVIRCKDCRGQGNISIALTKPALSYEFASAAKKPWQSVVKLDCRNMEPIEFSPKPDSFKAVAIDSGSVFEEVDVVSGEWYEYDAKESREVNITEVDFKIIRE